VRAMADVVVVLPGITGSVLRDSAGRDVWAPTAAAAARALVTLGRSLAELELRDPDADDGVTAPLMVPDLHLIPGLWKIDGYSRLSGYLQREFAVTPGRNFFAFPYDWRRDNRVAARRLKEQADRWLRDWRRESPQAKLVLVGHSMGGLVARYFLECLDGWRDTRRLVTFGTPYRGSLNALDFLVHGMQKKLGPVPVLDLSRLLRSFPSIYQLLPIYPCLDRGDGQLIRVSEAAGLPHVDQERARAADGFHREIERAVAAHLDDEEYRRGRYAVHPIVGTFQSTLLSARRSGDGVQVLRTFPGFVPDGDGTVPRVSATPVEFAREEGAMFAAERHGSLQHNDGVLVQLAGLLSGQDTSAVRAGADAGLAIDDAFGPGEPVGFRFRAADPMARLTAVVTAARTGAEVARVDLGAAGEWRGGELAPPPPGAYRLTLAGEGVEPVTDTFVVVGEQDPAETGEARAGDRRVRGGEPVVVSQAPPVRRSDEAVSRPDSSVFDDEEPGTGGFPSAPVKPHTADVNVAADMPSQLQVGKVASVTCRVSRDEIDAAAGRARADGRIAADPSRRITLEVLPKANVEVVGEDRADVPVPGVAETSDAYFDIRPTDIGICQVWVVVRQGPVPLLTLRLEAPAALEPQAVPIARYPVEAKVAVGVATGLEDGTWLSVVEMERGPDAVYRYELRSTTLKILATFESPPLRHRAEYVANLYREIENRWLTSNGDVEAFQEELREFGGSGTA